MGTTQTDSDGSESGQYLVEFGLSFVVFIIFVFFVIDMGLMIYNHNVFYHGVFVGAREASLGADNKTIRTTVVEKVVPSYLPTLFMRAHPDTGLTIRPPEEIERVEGTTVSVEMDSTFGLSLMGLYTMTLEVPISSQALIIASNDEDRDGCKDSLEAPGQSCSGYEDFASTYPEDHDNNGVTDQYIFNGPDQDADGDGRVIQEETIQVAYFQAPPDTPGYYISRPGADDFTFNGSTWWDKAFGGSYHAPVLWDDGTQSTPQSFARELSRWNVQNSSDTTFKRTLFSAYDQDNDGWEDKYDDFPNDPTRH